MKILLVNTNRYKEPLPVIPIGLCSVAASLEEAGFEVQVLDLCFSEAPSTDLQNKLKEFLPDVVGLGIRNLDTASGYPTFLIEDVKRNIVAALKAHFDGPIVVGGPALGINPKEILEYLEVPFAISGDGELAFPKLIRALRDHQPFDAIAGLTHWHEHRILVHNPPNFDCDVNALPFPKPYRYLDLRWYKAYKSPVQFQTKRGCALNCSYCTYNRIEGRHYRLKDVVRIVDEIEDTVVHSNIRHFEIADSTFNIPLSHAKRVLKELIARNLKLTLSTMGLHPLGFDAEFVDLLKQARFNDVSIGLESGSNATLAGLGKNFSTDDILASAALLRKARIPTRWFLLLGGPGETRATLEETFAFMRRVVRFRDIVVTGIGVRLYNGAPLTQTVTLPADNESCFRPQIFQPQLLSLEEVRVRATHEAMRNGNYVLYHQEANVPVKVLILFNRCFRSLAFWQMYILFRKLGAFTGIPWLLARLYKRKNAAIFAQDRSNAAIELSNQRARCSRTS